MEGRITEIDPPRKLTITWGKSGGVTFELESRGDTVLLTLTHNRLPGRTDTLNVSAGWHAHLDILAARLSGSEPEPFWDHWASLRQDYDQRLPE